MVFDSDKSERLLLHACCGPCSMEPVRILREAGLNPHIFYANSNIAPAEEYERRLTTLRDWAEAEGIAVTEGEYDPETWERTAGAIGPAEGEQRKARCRACYRQRFEQSALFASENGYNALGTTLSVSPYQYTEVIREELERACEKYGLKCAFEDYSPYYSEATRRSREAGMYRQNYCGCRFSDEEARLQREERAARKAERARVREAEEAKMEEHRRERREYEEKQRRKREVLKALREKQSANHGC